MSQSMDDIYRQIIASSARVAGFKENEYDDTEEIMTSKELVERHLVPNEKDGQIIPTPVQQPIEEEVHFKLYSKRRKHKYTEKEMAEIRSSCEATIVHDYGEHDMYHQTDEERRENDMLAEVRDQLRGLKRLYHRVDEYIEAMRIVVRAWEILEKQNYIHTREEFFDMVAKGKIVSSSIIMPKFKRINDYNPDLIIQYISNPDIDASTLRPLQQVQQDPWYNRYYRDFENDVEYQTTRSRIWGEWTMAGRQKIDAYPTDISEEELEEMKKKYYTEDDLDEAALDAYEIAQMHRYLREDEVRVVESADPPEMKVHPLERRFIKGYDARPGDERIKKKKKKLNKTERRIMDASHVMLNKIQTSVTRQGNSQFSRGFIVANGLFTPEKAEKNVWDELRYDGSLASDKDDFLNELYFRERLMRERAGGSSGYQTYSDIELQRFFATLEAAGVNTLELRRQMNMTDDDMRARNDRRTNKANKKVEAALIRRLTQLNRDPKFKKIIAQAEKDVNESQEED